MALLDYWLSSTKFYLIFLLLVGGTLKTYSQTDILTSKLLQIKAAADSITKKYPAEKLYLQFDKRAYAVGDTIWFKAYLLNFPTLGLSAQSGILYVDIADDKNTLVKQCRFVVSQGLSWGNISLTEAKGGNYQFRAYTRWMQNFPVECFFNKRFAIADVPQQNSIKTTGQGDNIIKQKVIAQERQLVQAQDYIDLQFMPEGGSLVAGATTRIGFKAVNKNGWGVKISGEVMDSKNSQVATFTSTHLGMGSFDLRVNPDERYTARVKVSSTSYKDYPLPKVKGSGLKLSVDNLSDQDSVNIAITATADMAKAAENYFLIGKARGVICYAAVFNFTGGNKIIRKLGKNLFPTGITHFVIMNTQASPLSERLVFINHHDNLAISAMSDNALYKPNDSIAFNIKIAAYDAKAAMGNFSVSVTDDALVSPDTLQDNILTHLLLTSELKGYIEQPVHYLAGNNESQQALDDLMLTQGWINYEWASDKKPVYAPETGFAVKGRVLSAFKKPVKAAKVTLLSKSPLIAMDTITNDRGEFTFRNFQANIDTPVFILNSVNKHNNRFNVNIVMDDAPVSPFIWQTYPRYEPALMSVDSGLIKTANNNFFRNQDAYLTPGNHVLKEVKITAAKIVKDSKNLNGPGNADFILDEKDLEKEGKKNWLDIFKGKIKGFKEGNVKISTVYDNILYIFLTDHTVPPLMLTDGIFNTTVHVPWYIVDDKPVKFIIDGISVGIIYKDLGMIGITDYLKSHSAEDLKGVELNFSPRYNSKYIPAEFSFYVSPADVSFLEITTRSGNGPVIDNTIGTYLYKPLPITHPAQFYEPRYTVINKNKHQPDNRATILWKPNINTDAEGKASFSFYAADKPSTYTLIIEGTDGNGNFGYKRQKIDIVARKEN